ncbi:hypothetical protein KL935_002127 [Ogataea polymorpha]|nr:hypothetical protein KL936_002352 [Ogataea polymorpha]KAG7894213.1 hypothetical protein KL908_002490 [Ogataea polymorpha]KAG7902167.1 hypothetical protein KL935_002127 [Ogataea polymorpha]
MSLLSRFGRSMPGVLPDRVLVAVSGGVDSMVLLDLTRKWAKITSSPCHIHAMTVDHGLRSESAQEAQKVHKIVKRLGLDHEVVRVPEKIDPGQLEKSARIWRYKLMYDKMELLQIDNLMVAHHFNDQLETFLIRLAASSTLFGLCGMRNESSYPVLDPFGSKRILRPLLDIRKNELYEYAREHNLEWFEDSTNYQPITLRNRVRKYLQSGQIEQNSVEQLMLGVRGAVDDVENDLRQLDNEVSVRFNSRFLKMSIVIPSAVFERYPLLSLDKFLFEKLYCVSAISNYHHRYTTLDSKNATLNTNDWSLSESILDGTVPEKFNLLKCLVRVVRSENNIHLLITRATEKFKQPIERVVNVTRSWSEWELFDNRIWFRARGKPGSYTLKLEANGLPAFYHEGRFLCYPTISGCGCLEVQTMTKPMRIIQL